MATGTAKGFAVFAGVSPEIIRASAREAEALGYRSFWVNNPGPVDGLKQMIECRRGVTGVGDVLTVHSSPDQITVMVSVDFDDNISAGEVEKLVHSIEIDAADRWPMVRRMFIRPQSGAGDLPPGAGMRS